MFLVLPESTEPLGLERDDIASGMVVGNLVGSHQQATIMGEQNGRALQGMRAEGGQVLNVFGAREQSGGEVFFGEQRADTILARVSVVNGKGGHRKEKDWGLKLSWGREW